MSDAYMADNIAAISTALGEGALGVVRMTGPGVFEIADRIFESPRGLKPSEQKPYTAQHGFIVDRFSEKPKQVDEVMLLVMHEKKSYTHECMVEISCHGSRIILQKVLDLCLKEGARLANPGEFTQRAFLNGRMDLAQAETVLEIIRAKTDRSHAMTQSHLAGEFSQRIKNSRDLITRALSHVEASLDFPDDAINPMKDPELYGQLSTVQQGILQLIQSSNTGLLVRNGLRVVLTGKPNTGKSSLFNWVCGKNRVLVSDEPGTTRDIIEEELQIQGFHIHLSDTAGLRHSAYDLEQQSIERAKHALSEADMVWFIGDLSAPLLTEEAEHWNQINAKSKIMVLNKQDIASEQYKEAYLGLAGNHPVIFTSCLKQEGMRELESAMVHFIESQSPEQSDELWVYSVRQLDLLRKAFDHMKLALEAMDDARPLELVASDLRLALDALGEIVGEIVTDDILDLVFSQFCIGK